MCGRDMENWNRPDFRLIKYWGQRGEREGRVRFRVFFYFSGKDGESVMGNGSDLK